MQEKYGAKGLTVLALTNEPRSLVDAFIAKFSPKHGIVIEGTDSSKTFDIEGYPTSYLIGPDGKVLSAGNPGEADIEKALALVRLPPKLPATLASVEPSLKKEKYAEARLKVTKLLEGTTLVTDEDKSSARDLMAWIDWLAQSGVDAAKAEGERGNWYEAALALESVCETFKGLPQATDADLQLKALMTEKAKKDEVTAGRRFQQAKDKQREKDLKPKEALPLFKAIASKYEATKAGKKATAIAAELERAAEGAAR